MNLTQERGKVDDFLVNELLHKIGKNSWQEKLFTFCSTMDIL